MTEGPSSPGPKIADLFGSEVEPNWPLRNGYNMVVNLMGRVTRPYVSECSAADKNRYGDQKAHRPRLALWARQGRIDWFFKLIESV
jgi:hypothetical protein